MSTSRPPPVTPETPLFVDDTAHELDADAILPRSAQKQKLSRHRAVAGVCVAAALVMGLIAAAGVSPPPADASSSVAETIEEYRKCAGIFEQCASQHAHDSKCCMPGCTCEVQSQYFSQCKPPEGSDTCDATKAAAEMKKVKDSMTSMEKALAKAKARMKATHGAWSASHKKGEAAQDELAEQRKSHAALAARADETAKKATTLTKNAMSLEAKLDTATRDAEIASARINLMVSRMSAWETALTKQGMLGEKLKKDVGGEEEEDTTGSDVAVDPGSTPYSMNEAQMMSGDGVEAGDPTETYQGDLADAEAQKDDALTNAAAWYNAAKQNR